MQIEAIISYHLHLKDHVYVLNFRNSTFDSKISNNSNPEYKYSDNKFYYNLSKQELQALVKKIDENIFNITNGEKFFLYAPNYSKNIVSIIATHKCNTGHILIEDGLGNYNSRENLKKAYKPNRSNLRKLLFKWRYGIRIAKYGFLPQKTKKIFTVSEHAMQDWPTILLKKEIKRVAKRYWEGELRDGDTLFVFDALVEFKISKSEKVVAAFESFLKDYKNTNTSTLKIKFHPEQNLKEVKKYVECIERFGVSYKIIGNNVIVEACIFNGIKVKLVGFVSSLLFYASLFGEDEPLSYAGKLDIVSHGKINPIFRQYVKIKG